MPLLARLIRLLPSEDPNMDWEFDDASFDQITELTEALIASPDPRLIPRLEKHLESCLERAEFYGRDVIGEVLAGVAGLEALPTLLRTSARDLGDDQDTFQTIICELLEHDPARARPAVLELVHADDTALRVVGVWALDFTLLDEDLPRVVTMLNDAHPDVRSVAAAPLAKLATRHRIAMDALAAALSDPEPHVRISVVSALGDTHATSAAGHVTQLIDDPNDSVRRWVTMVLQRLGPATES